LIDWNLMKSTRHLSLILLTLLLVRIADGQEARLVTNPSLGSALPLVETPDGVRLKFPVLLNGQTMVGPNALLRLVYVNSDAGLHLHGATQGDEGPGLQQSPHHHAGGEQGAPVNNGFSDLATRGGIFDPDHATERKESQEIGSELWRHADFFRDALDSATDLGTMLVYSVPGKAKPVATQINLPDGMLLGAEDNTIVVLALTPDSAACQAGLQPQDEMKLINDQSVPGSLDQFMRLYLAITQQARTAGQSYSFEVHRPTEAKLVTIRLNPPPSIPSMF
jgi:hypothetical protein